MVKRLICLVLCLITSTFLCVNVYSFEDSFIYDKALVDALNDAENVKDELGLSNVDFSKFEISTPIQCYEYTDVGLVETRQ